MNDVFAELQKGLNITSNLKKASERKLPNEISKKSQEVDKVKAKTEKKEVEKEPINEHKNNKWVIENQKKEVFHLDDATLKDSIYLGFCTEVTIIIPSKVNKITLNNCQKISLKCESVVSIVEIINCSSLIVTVLGKAASINIDRGYNVKIYLSEEAIHENKTLIFTTRSSEVGVHIPNDSPDEFPISYDIPQQFVSSFEDYTLVTKPSDFDSSLKNPTGKNWWSFRTICVFEDALKQTRDLKLEQCKKEYEKLFIIPNDYDGIKFHEQKFEYDDVMNMIEHFKMGDINIHFRTVALILIEAFKSFKDLPNVIEIDTTKFSSFTVCGDLHGDFTDLMTIFEKNGWPSETNSFLFNGDFIDRGKQSCEVILTLFAFRALYPNSFFLARGNHEDEEVARDYGFFPELAKKNFHDSFKVLFSRIFCYLPIAHLINNQIFVVHGGVYINDEGEVPSIEDINKIPRKCSPYSSEYLLDLLWSDTQENDGYGHNETRGAGHTFGPDITKKFLEKNKLKLLIRSHKICENGYKYDHDNQCLTVYSTSGSKYPVDNFGACVNFSYDLEPTFITYKNEK